MGKILVQAYAITKYYDSRALFENVNFSIFESEKLALYGPNGSGKSSLFKMIVGELESTSGEIHRSRSLVVGYLKQTHKLGLELTAEEYLEKYEANLKVWDVKKIASGLGFPEEAFYVTLESHSGGFRMRFYLACELAREPDLLLLDEPTNHLDLESVMFLETYLREFKKSFILISHDRELLTNACDQCLVLENSEVLKFKGDLNSYFAFQFEQREFVDRQNKKLEDKKKQLEAFVEKFRAKASKAKQAQSKVKQLERLGDGMQKEEEYFRSLPIPESVRTGKLVLEAASKTGLGYPDKPKVLNAFEFHLFRGDKIAIVGANGVGKTTLLKYLAKVLLDHSGSSPHYYKNVEASYFAQHLEQALPMGETLIDYISAKAPKDLPEQEILNLMGAMGFRDQDLKKKISVFSGGERMRIVLGEILLLKNPLLLLDEPTNHLDFETVESLTGALQKTDCSVVIVSHDRSFVSRVCDKIFEIKDEELAIYPGSYDDYIWSKKVGNPSKAQSLGASNTAKEPGGKKTKNYKEQKKKLEKQILKIKKDIRLKGAEVLSTQASVLELNQVLLEASCPAPEKVAIEISKKTSLAAQLEEAVLELMLELDDCEIKLEKLLG